MTKPRQVDSVRQLPALDRVGAPRAAPPARFAKTDPHARAMSSASLKPRMSPSLDPLLEIDVAAFEDQHGISGYMPGLFRLLVVLYPCEASGQHRARVSSVSCPVPPVSEKIALTAIAGLLKRSTADLSESATVGRADTTALAIGYSNPAGSGPRASLAAFVVEEVTSPDLDEP